MSLSNEAVGDLESRARGNVGRNEMSGAMSDVMSASDILLVSAPTSGVEIGEARGE